MGIRFLTSSPTEQLDHVQVFKAQRLFKAFCNKSGNITKEKWDEFLASASIQSCCLYPTLSRLLLAAQLHGCLPELVPAGSRVGKAASDCPDMDGINSAMERLDGGVRGMAKDQLLAELQRSTDAAMLCLVEARLAVLILGEEMALMKTPCDSRRGSKRSHGASETCAGAESSLMGGTRLAGFGAVGSKEAHEAILSARRSLMLNRQQPRMWSILGRMPFETGYSMYAGFAWAHGAALGSYSAAMQYGQAVSDGDNKAASAFKLAMRLASTGDEQAEAEKFFRDVVAGNPSCAEVAPLEVHGGTRHRC
ncbi:hypothetical protein SELMODRAFT_413016 [Selaginella moellendorffii]|uniref:Uncharacterized protein n=1 Tax=Selaginella moellendorffii TaxID=88036 RepID=D8RN28_SELML|nr:hypothetical protein SELMODRAFT_413016 [Selaginella moellendorffii]